MKSGVTIFIGLAIGVFWGIVSAETARSFSIIGDLYLAFLTMCALPIMAVALIAGVARLFQSRALGGFLRRIVTVFSIMLVIVGIASLLFGVLGKPGAGLSDNVREAVGKVLIQSVENSGVAEDARSPLAFVKGIIPANIFVAFVEGNTLQILFFCLIFGAILGLTPGETSEQFIGHLELVFEILQRAISRAHGFRLTEVDSAPNLSRRFVE